jgi:hypothetical protein
VVGYEALSPYIKKIAEGKPDILWPGLPVYFAKTSGTTSGSKYIPITRDSLPNHIGTARNVLFSYMKRSGNYGFADGNMIFLQGSPVLEKKGIIPAGRLSGIVAHHVPGYLQRNRMPSWETNCMEDWEQKVDAIVEETLQKRMTLISGIPSWLRMYFEKLVEREGRSVGEIFPDLSLIVYGGLNFEPYKAAFNELLGRRIDTVETYPASEGFIAFQDNAPGEGLLLNINSGIFFEFIPISNYHDDEPPRFSLEEVEMGVDYALLINNNAGLWGYDIGDTVRFVSMNPYRIVVTGRITQFISAFGEHVIASEVEGALTEVCGDQGVAVAEFTVAPVVNPVKGLPHHQWLIEFERVPHSLDHFAIRLDNALRNKNDYYDDLINGKILEPLKIITIPKGLFSRYLESKGRLGGQNKVVHVSDNRDSADEIIALLSSGDLSSASGQ